METSPVTCRTLEEFYHVDARTFDKQYKATLSGFREWKQLEHADQWLLFPNNIGPRLAIEESSLSDGEFYIFVTNRDAKTRDQSLAAVVAGTRSEDVITVLEKSDEERRYAVEEVTLDLSDSMRKIVRTAFPKAGRVIDRFHIQKLACDAVQELRIKRSWDAIQQANDEMEEAKLKEEDYADPPTVTQERNCLSAHVISCSNRLTNGLTGRNDVPPFSLKNILPSKRHTVCATP